jgi:nitroimidazol reductase NimA-like FMN-containing flavoprotein (pyridoxamine 5'-phosphate oxidase superfamily)
MPTRPRGGSSSPRRQKTSGVATLPGASATGERPRIVEIGTWRRLNTVEGNAMIDRETSVARQEIASVPVEAPADYPFPRGQDGLLPWSRAREQLVRARYYWLATVRADGRPHVAPLWGGWVNDLLYFDGSPETRWARNIAANPAASVNLENGNDVVIVEGTVEFLVADAALAARLVDVWTEKYGRFQPEADSRGIFRLRPRSARAWSTENMQDGARWFFSGD